MGGSKAFLCFSTIPRTSPDRTLPCTPRSRGKRSKTYPALARCTRNRWVQAMAAQGQTGPGSKKGAMNSIILDSSPIRYGIKFRDLSDGAWTAIESFAVTAHSFPGS